MGSYEDCMAFLSKQGIKLFDYQKEILKVFIENKSTRTARTPRGSGIRRPFVVVLNKEQKFNLSKKR